MPRLMSVRFTEQAVVDRIKTVTRRKGWWLDKNGRHLVKVGDRLTLVRKSMGRKPGEELVRLAEVEVVSVRRERLSSLLMLDAPRMCVHELRKEHDRIAGEMEREGFPGLDPAEFVMRYFVEAQGMTRDDEVTRIEWRYLDGDS